MKTVLLKGNSANLDGNFLKTKDLAPDFTLVNQELVTITLAAFKGRKKLLVTVPSVDTPVCGEETRKMAEIAKKHPEIVILVISKDLPFAQKRFCLQEKIDNVTTLSDIRPTSHFGKNYGVLITSGPLAGLLARSLILLDDHDKVLYSELVPEITSLPNFDALATALH